MMNVGIIGYGYWGPNLVRNFSALNNCKVHIVSDYREERLNAVKKFNANINTTTNPDDIILSNEIEAVVIATPVFTHYDLAKRALNNGKHVLLEKPMTSTVKEAEELIALANAKGLLLMVDHTFLYTGAVKKMKELIDNKSIGNTQYFDSSRINLGLFQPDVNVLWDLAPHDISMLLFLTDYKPYSVNATGVSHTKNGIENIAYLTVNYKEDFIAHFSCSWTSPVKLRTLLIGGDKKMMLFNDLEPSEKIRVYDTGYNYQSDEEKKSLLVDYRTGDVFIPKVEMKEALLGMADNFVSSIKNKTTPVSSAQLGLDVIKILEAAQLSIKQNGKEIIL
ncbi:MAG: Gfo/Idh/MocA family oxidoreductase [Bacteroidota bacterium]|nr:Gfo/Idh/MocA family oxidoreductase [Bacteroidota bacterium]